MRRFLFAAALAALLALPSLSASADTVTFKAPRPRLSPHDTASASGAGLPVVIVYGRPHTADPHTGAIRTVWGGQLVPVGQVWRTGADEATLLITGKTLTLGDGPATVTLPAGAYSLYTLMVSPDEAKLIVNHQVGQWGTHYDPSQDVGRVPLHEDTLEPAVHQFTIAVQKTGAASGVIKLQWESKQFSVPFTVTD
ncbi:MAG TPA: DUF2911 domain-containing protein [Opitutaceae bacterium]|jgi:hypothetical protein|nr:DUF2911 domain-containing protein [Opitutaceae bacterium]